jgi:cysteinyl-tRNA synthetase
MSKSLKNFITVKEFFQTFASRNHSDDFRIFCLQHKYSSSLNYSTERLEEAATHRHRMENILGYYDAYRSFVTRNPILVKNPPRKPTKESKELSAFVSASKSIIHNALKNDFDTPTVMNQIFTLLGASSQYLSLVMKSSEQYVTSIQNADIDLANSSSTSTSGVAVFTSLTSGDEAQPQRHPIEPLVACMRYVASITSMLGLTSFPISAVSSSSVAAVVQSNTIGQREMSVGIDSRDDAKTFDSSNSALIDAVVQFRSSVRSVAISGIADNKKMTTTRASAATDRIFLEGSSQHFNDILVQCDKMRAEFSKSFSIKIEDIGKSDSRWSEAKPATEK